MEPGAEHCDTSTTPAGWHGFLVPEHSFAIDPEARGQRARLSYTVKTQPERTDAVRSLYERFMAATAKHPNLEFSPGARMVEAELQSLLQPLLGCDDAPHTAPGRPPLSRKEIVQRALVVLEEVGDEPIHVSELSAQADVSERTLRKAFNDYYQIGPRRYLNVRQLHKARRDLLVSDPEETSVTEILVRWGVWEFGRFAGRYRRHFGELPSETLRRRHVAALR
jgi:AraC-like DNA-binding protein